MRLVYENVRSDGEYRAHLFIVPVKDSREGMFEVHQHINSGPATSKRRYHSIIVAVEAVDRWVGAV